MPSNKQQVLRCAVDDNSWSVVVHIYNKNHWQHSADTLAGPRRCASEFALKIVIAEKVSPATLAILKNEPGWEVVTADGIPAGGLPAALADADALIVRSAVQADAELLEHAPKLRLIGRAGVGVDNIDTAAATRRGIVVMNTPGANAVAVAELTLGLMVAMARAIPRANAGMHEGKWDKKTLQGTELRGKTLGIVGCGRIGLEVARRAKAFGMKLIGYDPFLAPVIARENDIALVAIEDLFAESDYLSLHVGLTPQTEGLINKMSLAITKPGVRIVNCARGELIVDEALADALKSGHVAGAALDVFRREPLKDSSYFELPNVLLSPHIAGATDEAQEAIGVQLANQVRDYLKLGVVQNAVNTASLSEEEYAEVSPYIEMAARLGMFLADAMGAEGAGNIESLTLHYNGRIAQLKTDLLRNAAIAGLLHGASGFEGVNRINAATAAAERGIRLEENKREYVPGGTGATLRLIAHTAASESAVTGTVLHGSSARLVRYDGIDIEAELAGTLLVLRNNDVPGVIGQIGTVLGEAGLNIANFALGRRRAESVESPSRAVAFVQLDATEATEAVLHGALERLRAIEAISSARVVKLGGL